MAIQRRTVYVIRSITHPTRYYVGLTINVAARLAVHNSGGSQHTAARRPWELVTSIEFAKESSAMAFEKYLKSGSGRAFAKRHFV
jgi:predicted GIY-YIG superfamily endonuclease